MYLHTQFYGVGILNRLILFQLVIYVFFIEVLIICLCILCIYKVVYKCLGFISYWL